jgi:hypothetical protein
LAGTDAEEHDNELFYLAVVLKRPGQEVIMRKAITASIIALTVGLALASACRRAPQVEPYTPGLGEMMTLQQMRHTKLWLAGEAGNWDLAAYEIKELGEGFDDIVKYHPTHEESPVAPRDAVPRMVTAPVEGLRAAIQKKDARVFEPAFDALTKACNDCHQATNFGFNVVQRPATNPYPNQLFTLAAK